MPEGERVILIVDLDYSWCSVCKNGADPTEASHQTRLPNHIGTLAEASPGCGRLFTHKLSAHTEGGQVLSNFGPEVPELDLAHRESRTAVNAVGV